MVEAAPDDNPKPVPKGAPRGAGRRAGLIGLILVLLAVVLAGTVRFGPLTPVGRAMIEQAIDGQDAGRLGRLTVQGLRGDIWGRFSIQRVTIADRGGVWLDARDLRVDWDPAALLGRRLRLRSLSAVRILLDHRPLLKPSTGGGSAPVAIDVDSFATRLELLPGFAEVHGLYDIGASIRLERNGAARGQIAAASDLHAGDFLRAVFDLGGKGAFHVTADALEAKGGALAGAVGFRADQTFSLMVRAAGDAQSGRFTALARSGALTPVQAGGSWSRDGGVVDGQIDLTSSRLLAWCAKVAGPSARLHLTGRRAGDGFDAVEIALESANIHLAGHGELNFAARRLGPRGMAVDLRMSDPSPVIAYPKMGEAHLAGTLTGDSVHWVFAGSESVDHPTDSLFSLARVSGPLRLESRPGDFLVEAVLAGEGGAGEGVLAALLGARPSASLQLSLLDGGRVLIRQFDVSGAGLKVTSNGDRTLLGGLSARGEATITNLAAAHAGAAGVIKASWSASQAAGDHPWRFSFDAGAEHFASGLGQGLDHLLGPTPRLSAQGEYGGGRFNVLGSTLSGATGAVTAVGQIGPDAALSLALGWNASGPLTIGPLEIDGQVSGKGSLAGTLGDPRAELTASFGRLNLPSLPLDRARMQLEFARADGAGQGRISLTGDSDYGPAQGAATFRFVADGVDLSAIDLKAGGVSAGGAASLRAGRPSSADLTVSVGPGMLLSDGAANGRVKIVQTSGDPKVDLDVTASSAVFAENGVVIKSLKLTASGPMSQLPYSMTANGATVSGPWRVSGGGMVAEAGAGRSVTFTGGARLSRVDVRTLSPARFELGPHGQTASLRLGVGTGLADIDVATSDAGIDAKASLSGVNLDVLSQDYVGRFSANLAVAGKGATLSGLLDARLAGAGGRDLKGVPPVDGQIKAQLVGGEVVVDASLGNSQGMKATSSLILPVDASAAPFRIAVNTKRPVKGVFAIDGELKPLWDLMMGGERSLSGHVVASGDLGGTLADPRLVGTAALDNGQFRDSSTGLKLQNVNLRATLANNAIDFSQFSAADSGRGQLSGGGRISLLRDGVSTLRLDLQRFRLLDNDFIQATASGQVDVNRGADGHVKLSGDLTIDHAQISPKSPVATGVVPMDVVEVHQPVDVDARFAAAPQPAAPVALDMRLHSPGGILVKGRGLNLELSLESQVGGNTASPTLTGSARVVRGDYNFAAQRFQIDDRGVIYLGSTPQTIRLDLTATREDPTLTAVIRIQGTAAKPTIILTSTPVLPQDEVMSQVLFGASASQLSPLQAAQLASAVSGLASGGGFDVIGGLRNFVHLDRLAIGTEVTPVTVSGGKVTSQATTAMTVSGGKYITNNVYLELIGGRDGSGAQVEWRVRKHVSLVSRVTSQGDSQVSVRWRRDY